YGVGFQRKDATEGEAGRKIWWQEDGETGKLKTWKWGQEGTTAETRRARRRNAEVAKSWGQNYLDRKIGDRKMGPEGSGDHRTGEDGQPLLRYSLRPCPLAPLR